MLSSGRIQLLRYSFGIGNTCKDRVAFFVSNDTAFPNFTKDGLEHSLPPNGIMVTSEYLRPVEAFIGSNVLYLPPPYPIAIAECPVQLPYLQIQSLAYPSQFGWCPEILRIIVPALIIS